MRGLCVALALVSSLSAGNASRDPDGARFFCGARPSAGLCLSALRPGCRLEFVRGASIPPEAEDHVLLQSGTQSWKVEGPAQLTGCVSIQSTETAIEYLRFFSSYRTVHMFQRQELEVIERQDGVACTGACISGVSWTKLRLAGPRAAGRGEKFRVTRFVIKPFPKPWKVSLYRVVDEVSRDGGVRRLSERQVTATPDDLGDLNFPMYL